MVTVPRFAIAQLRLVLDAAAEGEASAREACGLLLADGAEVVPERTRNVSATPRDSFEIDPAALLAAHRSARAGGPALLGCWHTHPSGSPAPSPRDARDAAADGRLWLIATAREARLWRAVTAGTVHGRFDPVGFDVVATRGPEHGLNRDVVKRALAVQRPSAGPGLLAVPGGGSLP